MSSDAHTATEWTPSWKHEPHSGFYVNSVAISGDASRVVGGTFFHGYGRGAKRTPENHTFGTYCWDAAGTELWSHEFDGFEGVYWVAISNDGKVAASGGWQTGHPNYAGFVRAFDAATGSVLLDYQQTTSRTNTVALSQDGSLLAAASDSVYLFHRKADGSFDGAPAIHPLAGTGNVVETLALSENGEWMVFGDHAGNIYMASTANGRIGPVYQWSSTKQSPIHSVAIAANGSLCVAAGNDGYVYCFTQADIATGNYTWRCKLTTPGACYGVAISPAGDLVAGVGNKDTKGAVSLIKNSGDSGAIVWTYDTHRNPNSASIAGLFGGKSYVCVADGHPDGEPGNFYLLDPESGDLLRHHETSNMSWPMSLAQTGVAAVGGSDDGYVYYFPTNGSS